MLEFSKKSEQKVPILSYSSSRILPHRHVSALQDLPVYEMVGILSVLAIPHDLVHLLCSLNPREVGESTPL